jgi:glycosyltransferase involved in cell wall biosynthesis
LENRVSFIGRVIDREIMKGFYARADLLLFPSLYDTASLVMREAAAMSTPSVLVEGASTAEGITDGEDGFISANNPASYAQVLSKVMENPRLITRVGKGAKKKLYLPWEKVVDMVYDRYIDIIENFKSQEPYPGRDRQYEM